jgi:hypothetical protein
VCRPSRGVLCLDSIGATSIVCLEEVSAQAVAAPPVPARARSGRTTSRPCTGSRLGGKGLIVPYPTGGQPRDLHGSLMHGSLMRTDARFRAIADDDVESCVVAAEVNGPAVGLAALDALLEEAGQHACRFQPTRAARGSWCERRRHVLARRRRCNGDQALRRRGVGKNAVTRGHLGLRLHLG